MRTGFKWALGCLLFLGILALFVFYVSTHNVAVLEPKGKIGEKERELFIISSLLMLIVVIPAYLMTFIIAKKYQEGHKGKYTPNWEHNSLAETIWWGVPFIIVIILAIVTWKTTHELSPFKPIASEKKGIPIQVVALQWKWLFIYPEEGIAAINYLEFPEHTPLNFEITADAPMNSFWIPQLGSQIYAMPAMKTKLHLIAHELGDYKGLSSNLSGEGFAGMTFIARASTEDKFEDWIDSVKREAPPLTWDVYQELAQPTSYQPVQFYNLSDPGLFEKIIRQYTMPASH